MNITFLHISAHMRGRNLSPSFLYDRFLAIFAQPKWSIPPGSNIKDENSPRADVIDGQQRLTTLTILFAVVADAFQTEDIKNDCRVYLQEKGNMAAGM